MRVVATEKFKTYFRMKMIRAEEGQEFAGDLAEHLLHGRCPVEQVGEPPTGEEPGEEPGETGETGELDIGGTAEQVLAWVGDDPERANQANGAESAKDKPRSTLVAKLEQIIQRA